MDVLGRGGESRRETFVFGVVEGGFWGGDWVIGSRGARGVTF